MSEQSDVTTVTRVMGRCPSCNQELSGEIDLVVKTDKPFLHPDGTPKVRAEAYRCGMRLTHECGPDDLSPTFADIVESFFGVRPAATSHQSEEPAPRADSSEGQAS